MSTPANGNVNSSRRQFLATAGAAFAASSLPLKFASAQANPPYMRVSLDKPEAAPMVDSYKKAVTAMLKLPPTDARNWYRNAFIHILDCPHQNWWFLPWHRGYLGWFEETCRSLSGDPKFALPYWDWTAEQGAGTLGIPQSFQGSNNPLDPASSLYINGFAAFQQQFTPAVHAWWTMLTGDQLSALNVRGFSSEMDFWSAVQQAFLPGGQTRDPSFAPPVPATVKLSTIKSALNQKTFTTAPSSSSGFGSDQAAQHSDFVGEGILESMPHDNIHGAVGGWMGQFLSPVDPIFFMHHSNLDRLWDVWTRKQQKLGLPTLPTSGLQQWNQEPFLFYVGPDGQPIATKNSDPAASAGNYATIGKFNYVYQPGSGEDVIPSASPTKFGDKPLLAKLSSNTLKVGQLAIADAALPEGLFQEVNAANGSELVAKITLVVPPVGSGTRFHILVNPPKGVRDVPFNDPSFAGSITPFGSHSHGKSAVSFSVPITDAVKNLQKANRLKPGEPLQIHVVAASKGVSLAPVDIPLKSVSILAH